MSSDSHDELSLFSGMTFSSQTSSDDGILDKSTGDEQGIQESKELREIFEKLEVTKGVQNIFRPNIYGTGQIYAVIAFLAHKLIYSANSMFLL